MMAKANDSKKVVSATVLAAHLDMTRQRIAQLDREGVLVRLANGHYDLDRSRISYVRWLRSEGRRPVKTAAKSRFEDARARAIEIRNAQADGRLIETSEAIAFVDEAIGSIKSAFDGVASTVTRDLTLRHQIQAAIDRIFGRAAERMAAEAEKLGS